jgi:hypothetical protein
VEDKAIVLVTDPDDNKHGEISVLGDREEAQRLVESLLEAGFERGRIRVFTGGEMKPQASDRLVVSLVSHS